MATETETKTHKPAGTGGKKGAAIMSARAEHPDWSRKQIAEHVGCTVQRVGEAFRAAGIKTERDPLTGRKGSNKDRAAKAAAEAFAQQGEDLEQKYGYLEGDHPELVPDVTSLRALAKERGVKGAWSMNKTQLLEVLQ